MAYCYRCERPFRTLLALNQHTYDSSKHHMCPECTGDFKTLYELREHLVDEHDGCPECYDIFDSESDLQDHLFEEHNMCSICNQFFKSPSNLKYHQLVHREKTVKCFACYRMFVTKSAMVLHLEEGTCKPGIDVDVIDDLATDCYESHKYLDNDGDYKCPTCAKYFRFMSGLLQHAESDSCDETLRWKHGPLAVFLRFLKTRV
ncbi:uncharacterized protein TrAFT101_009368 [Trichoderma asperellum]|uniref:C2H2-type domain-containing protein n=1 Tax=Trichoderma asperellum (strain ATCC 204424 / CBS 433.97 / NBRC 101777) TaxID=1042311 RepID=A0A2T3YSP5_TRIA4|nr:hypothetical protein M441DRAFT_152850 [Trichoderma asperellum CBS 433.97]PTB35590.1 hypothetical protein M441DRAFT_152850 [Trichoderma asperellum CBS 433.97]UKZ94496.1 hypothetical protein TrAFT101_009368 [Trichoderma asperellum]